MSAPTVPTPGPEPTDSDRVVTLVVPADLVDELLAAADRDACEWNDRDVIDLVAALREQVAAQGLE